MKQLRLLIAEWILWLAFCLMPIGNEKSYLAGLLTLYFKYIKIKK